MASLALPAQAQTNNPYDNKPDAEQFWIGEHLVKVDKSHNGNRRGPNTRPDGVRHTDVKAANRQGKETKANHIKYKDKNRRPYPGKPLRELHAYGTSQLKCYRQS